MLFADLTSGGLAQSAGPGDIESFKYDPRSESLRSAVGEVVDAYNTRPVTFIRAILRPAAGTGDVICRSVSDSGRPVTMALIIYMLCAATSLACAVLLFRGYRRTTIPLLLWSGLCFTGFFINNIILIIDLRILPEQDLSVIRSLPLLAGISCLLYGLITEKK